MFRLAKPTIAGSAFAHVDGPSIASFSLLEVTSKARYRNQNAENGMLNVESCKRAFKPNIFILQPKSNGLTCWMFTCQSDRLVCGSYGVGRGI